MEQNININGIISTCKDEYSNAMDLVKEKLVIYLEGPKVFGNEYEIGTPGFRENLKDNLKRSSAIVFDFIAVYRKYEENEEIKKILAKASNIYEALEEAIGNINEDIHKSLKQISEIEF
ncbi:hypothetical protein [Clostridium sp. B9]|uniref:hypothetical protein n=1 Tax=Clostridium sp. B9 TaxID=3423224 RepID=UPI003D2EDFE4